MFTTNVSGGKAFVAEQTIHELIKSKISKLKAISDKNEAKIPPTTISDVKSKKHKYKYKSENKAENISDLKSKKYGIIPIDIEKKSLTNERFFFIFFFYKNFK